MHRSAPAALAAFAALASAVLTGAAAASPSFDCAKAGTATEHAICASARLSALDRALAEAYRAARSGVGAAERDRIRSEQIDWLGARDACAADPDCLAERMEARIAALRDGAAGRGDGSGLTGVYCQRDGADALVVEVRGQSAVFALSSWQANGHHCGTPALTARRAEVGWVAQDGDCTLRLAEEDGAVVLTAAPFDACKARYCGARAAMNRFEFQAASRRPLPAPAAEISLMETDVCR